jgi:hypothetical protein
MDLVAPKAVPLADTREMIRAPSSGDWRPYRLRTNAAILVIEFPHLVEQGRAMNRMAAMFEKRAGNRHQLLNDGDLDRLIQAGGDNVASFLQGHDYSGAQLARFYSMASSQKGLTLSAQELRLRQLLVDAAVLRPQMGGVYTAIGKQAVVSFTAIQQDDPATKPDESVDAIRRESVLRHELSHGEFFTNDGYREYCLNYWRNILTTDERMLFRRYLEGLDYDSRDEELMANESQALLMHTSDTRAFSATALGVSESVLARLRDRFASGSFAFGEIGKPMR